MAKSRNEDVSLDMTPMIDVVFQLIIFFVVTLKMTDNNDTTIRLEDGRNGIVLTQDELPKSQLTIDVLTDESGRGVYKMGNWEVTPQQIEQKVKERYLKFLDFPCMIRADWRTQHQHVRKVYQACLAGQYEAHKLNPNIAVEPKISFVAIQKPGKESDWSLAARNEDGTVRPPKKKKKKQ